MPLLRPTALPVVTLAGDHLRRSALRGQNLPSLFVRARCSFLRSSRPELEAVMVARPLAEPCSDAASVIHAGFAWRLGMTTFVAKLGQAPALSSKKKSICGQLPTSSSRRPSSQWKPWPNKDVTSSRQPGQKARYHCWKAAIAEATQPFHDV